MKSVIFALAVVSAALPALAQQDSFTCPALTVRGKPLSRFNQTMAGSNIGAQCGWYADSSSCCDATDVNNLLTNYNLTYYISQAPYMDVFPDCWNLLAQQACAVCSPKLPAFYNGLTTNGTSNQLTYCRGFCGRVFDACYGSSIFPLIYGNCSTRDGCCSALPEDTQNLGICFNAATAFAAPQQMLVMALLLVALVFGVLL